MCFYAFILALFCVVFFRKRTHIPMNEINEGSQDGLIQENTNNDDDMYGKLFGGYSSIQSNRFTSLLGEIRLIFLGFCIIASGIGSADVDISESCALTKFFFFFVRSLTLSSKNLENNIHSDKIILSIALTILVLMLSYPLLLLVQFKFGGNTNNTVKTILLSTNRCLSLYPGMIIGKYFGIYFNMLTRDTNLTEYVPVLLLDFISLFVWLWVVILSSYIYHGKEKVVNKQKKSLSQVWKKAISLDIFLSVIPLINSGFIDVASSVFDSKIAKMFFFLWNLIICIYVYHKIINVNPFVSETLNSKILYFIYSSTLFSVFPFLSALHPKTLDFSMIIIIILSIVGFFFNRFISKFSTKSKTEQENQMPNFLLIAENHIQQGDHSYPLISLKKQDIFVISYLAVSLIFMVYLNAMAAQRMPETKALPDYFHEKFPIADAIRNSKYFGEGQISNVACVLNAITCLSLLVIAKDTINARKALFIYGTLAFIRGISFFITSMPAPCSGTAKCPCADSIQLKNLREGNSLKIAASWLFGLGMFLSYPQCGDLIISGHTMFLWLSTKTILDVIKVKIPTPLCELLSYSWIIFIIASLVYITISRNHYSIDVWFGFLFPQLLWDIYTFAQKAVKIRSNNESFTLKLIRWLETRKVPLLEKQEDEKLNDSSNVDFYDESDEQSK